ncbi:MAG: glucose-6-phosphate isomerase family protein [Candidatus Bathyarchaeia archaeon]
MSKSYKPKLTSIRFDSGVILHATSIKRRLSDLKTFFMEKDVVEEMLKSGLNPLIYEVYECTQPAEKGHLNFGTTILKPGKIGKEFYLTKGHYHLKDESSEVYLGFKGEGLILLQSKTGETKVTSIGPGKVVYVPPKWGHRTVNVGNEELVFFFTYPADAGHDYETVEKSGFLKLVVEKNGRPEVVDNPRT